EVVSVAEKDLRPADGPLCVAVLEGGHVVHVQREYHPESGRPVREERFDSPSTGGKEAVGATKENWYRKVARTFDPASGKVTGEQVFRWDDTKNGDERWVRVTTK